MHTEQIPAKLNRMAYGDYVTVYARQTLEAIRDTRPAPECCWDFLGRFQDQRPLIDAAYSAADELFGKYPCEDGTRLFKVENLTLKESAIAARMDLSHPEKIELIRPLRERRRSNAENRPYRPSKWELEYRRQREERIVASVAETMAVSDEDRSWARKLRINLDD